MTDAERTAICQKKIESPHFTQKQLITWVETTLHKKISQGTLSNTLKRSAELLADANTKNRTMKRHKAVKYPLMEDALSQWFEANEAKVLMSGELLKLKRAFFLNRLYLIAGPFEFSNGWLNRFKSRFEIKSYRRFGESGSVDMAVIEQARHLLCELLDSYELRDIYNMDETGLFYRMQADNSLATMQLEGRKQSKERITAAVCCNGDGSDKMPL